MNQILPALRSGSLLSPFLGDVFEGWPGALAGRYAASREPFPIDVVEYEDRYLITADLPGYSSEELDITLKEKLLSIQAMPANENSKDSEPSYIIRERQIGAMCRTILLPHALSAESVDASLRNGVLTVTIKKDERLMPKRIKIQ